MKEYRNPVPTVDIILQRDSKILMIRRKRDPFKGRLVLPGGFVNEGEAVEEAVIRETMEETSLEIEPVEILGVYSDPRRDPRKHIISVVFVGIIIGGTDNAGDDAEKIEWLEMEKIQPNDVAFDHMKILDDYKRWRSSGGTYWSKKRGND